MDKVDQKKTEEQQQVDYIKTEMQMQKMRKQPSKISEFPLVAYVQKGDELIPVYRSEE